MGLEFESTVLIDFTLEGSISHLTLKIASGEVLIVG
jgi:hypothetical protein